MYIDSEVNKEMLWRVIEIFNMYMKTTSLYLFE